MEPAGEVLAPPGVVVERLGLSGQLVNATARLGPGPGQELAHPRRLGRRPGRPALLHRLQRLDQGP